MITAYLGTVADAFNVKRALLAGHAQHPVMIHFPIALFIASVVLDILALWRRKLLLATVASYNLFGAALTVPFAIATGLGAWQWQLEGASLKGALLLHMIFALTSASLIFILCGIRSRLRARGGVRELTYFLVTLLTLLAITITGHLGGVVSGVEG
jgi:uncharacterized membrane protein